MCRQKCQRELARRACHPDTVPMRSDEEFALELDASDTLAPFRGRFELPTSPDGERRIYLLGNSLGPLPREARQAVHDELDAWARRGVEGYFEAPSEWARLDKRHRGQMAAIVGGHADEIAFMNGLSVNLHLLLASFFDPSRGRRKILIEPQSFPSDRQVVETHLRWHGIDPEDGLLELADAPSGGNTSDAIVEALQSQGQEVALALFGGVNYATGELLAIDRIVEAGHQAGCLVGFDLAHAAGNVPLALHEWGVDFAAWCSYKYLNCGPGGPGGVFVHRKHSTDPAVFRLGGWWGTDPEARFRWTSGESFAPRPGGVGWQLSCPSVLSFAPLGPSLQLFSEAGMERIREKSVSLTGYLVWLLDDLAGASARIITPRDPTARGAQISLRVRNARQTQEAVARAGLDTDVREPDILRLAPAPLFNSYHEVWRAARIIAARLKAEDAPHG